MKKERNVGKTDRRIRIFLGIVIFVFAVSYPEIIGEVGQWILYLVTLILIVTAFRRFCLLYKIFGWKSYQKK